MEKLWLSHMSFKKIRLTVYVYVAHSKICHSTNTTNEEYMKTTDLRMQIILSPNIRIFSTLLV